MNKSTAQVREWALQHSQKAINELARIMMKGESEQARVAAAKEILDRSAGKAPQAHTIGGDDSGVPVKFQQIARTIIDPDDTDS